MQPVTGKMSKMKIGAIKEATPEALPHVIPEVKKIPKTGTVVDSPRSHKYNTRSTTQRIHYVTTFKNAPTVFPMEPTEKIKLHRGSDYYVRIDHPKDTITLELTEKRIHCDTT